MIDLPAALGAVPVPGGDLRTWTTAELLELSSPSLRARVVLDGGLSVWLPLVPPVANYVGYDTVFVLRDPVSGPLVVGPCGSRKIQETAPPQPPAKPDEPEVNKPSYRRITKLIRPAETGTYRASRGAWGRWNTDRYGSSALWQGDAYGSGSLTGAAFYGRRVSGLRARDIERIDVLVPRAEGSGSVGLAASSLGSRPNGAPSSGTTAASGSGSRISLPAATREQFRTGDARGLVLTGAAYLAIYGTSRGSGMALSITYTRSV